MLMSKLIDAQEEYIALLEKECGNLIGLAHVHGYEPDWKDVARGEELRKIIAHVQSGGIDISGVKLFLEQIVSVDPENEALWISTVKANAYGYLGDLALINQQAGDDFPEPHMEPGETVACQGGESALLQALKEIRYHDYSETFADGQWASEKAGAAIRKHETVHHPQPKAVSGVPTWEEIGAAYDHGVVNGKHGTWQHRNGLEGIVALLTSRQDER